MSATEIQKKIVQIQEQLTELQAETVNGEFTPNADEALLAFLDAGQKALQAVRDMLRKLG